MNNSRHAASALLFLVTISSGCAVGPDFRHPAPPGVTDYTSTRLANSTASASDTVLGASQNIVVGEKVDRYWWHKLGSSKLNALITEALRDNPTLNAAKATLRQAQELYAAKSGTTLYPRVEGSLSGQRQRFNPGTSGQSGEPREFSLYNANVGLQYTFDLAGGNRRALEALAARSDYRQFELEAARLTLVANIVTTAITQARLAMQIEAVENIVRSQEGQLDLARERVLLGQAAQYEVGALQTQLEQTRASIPLLRNQIQQTEHLLAILAGHAPGAGILPSFTLEEFTLPSDLPLLVPSELVRARPDILGAEALLHAANAEFGVAISKLYPQLNLSADLGSLALTTGALFGSGSAVWSLVGQLTQPLFNPGLSAEKRAALAAFDAAAANYQVVVLESLRNVADVLRTLGNDSERLATLSAAYDASQKFLNSIQNRYALGAASYYDLLTAQQQSQQVQLDLIEGQAKCLVNSVAFYQAMGGGITSDGEVVTSSP